MPPLPRWLPNGDRYVPDLILEKGLYGPGRHEEPVVIVVEERSPTRVVHCKRDEYDVYIGRGSPYGNPFRIGPDGDREAVIAKFEQYLSGRPELLALVPSLKGKRLGCFCAPRACHGHVWARYADEAA